MAEESKISDGGPAFPVDQAGAPRHPGMSLWDYFAAKAPEPPCWFEPPEFSMPRPADPGWGEFEDGSADFSLIRWAASEGEDVPEEYPTTPENRVAMQAVIDARRALVKARNQWQKAKACHDFVSWRWSYADAMLAAREGKR